VGGSSPDGAEAEVLSPAVVIATEPVGGSSPDGAESEVLSPAAVIATDDEVGSPVVSPFEETASSVSKLAVPVDDGADISFFPEMIAVIGPMFFRIDGPGCAIKVAEVETDELDEIAVDASSTVRNTFVVAASAAAPLLAGKGSWSIAIA